MVRLVRADLELMDAALAGDDALARALGHDGFRFDGEAREDGRPVGASGASALSGCAVDGRERPA